MAARGSRWQQTEQPILTPGMTTKKMSLSLLRQQIRAGRYQDDLHDLDEKRLAFVRWLIQQGKLKEQ
jgi:hypothetical protein